ncbi:hypothetical protein AcV5_007463 [Taiwanofungus camphoratus]|nr:hypothetical protein AcV5_007463 [Antrodia cinnamomea]
MARSPQSCARVLVAGALFFCGPAGFRSCVPRPPPISVHTTPRCPASVVPSHLQPANVFAALFTHTTPGAPQPARVCMRRFLSAVSTSRSPREARGAVLVPALWRCGVSSGYRPVRRGPAGRRRAPGLRVHEDATRCARAPPACHAFPPSCPLGFGVRGVPLTREQPPRHGAARSGDVRTTDSLGLASVPVRDLAPPPCTPFSSIAPRAAARVPGWALGRCAHAVARTHAAIPGWAKVHEYSRRQSTSSPSIHLVLHLRAPVYCPIFPAAKCALPPQSPPESPAHVRGCAPTPPPPPCPVFLFFLCAGFAARTPCDWDTASSGPGNRCQCRPLRTGAAAQSGDAHAQTGTPPRLAPTLPQNLPARASCQRLSDRRATPVCDACPCTRPSVFHTRQASRGRSGDSARPAGQRAASTPAAASVRLLPGASGGELRVSAVVPAGARGDDRSAGRRSPPSLPELPSRPPTPFPPTHVPRFPSVLYECDTARVPCRGAELAWPAHEEPIWRCHARPALHPNARSTHCQAGSTRHGVRLSPSPAPTAGASDNRGMRSRDHIQRNVAAGSSHSERALATMRRGTLQARQWGRGVAADPTRAPSAPLAALFRAGTTARAGVSWADTRSRRRTTSGALGPGPGHALNRKRGPL